MDEIINDRADENAEPESEHDNSAVNKILMYSYAAIAAAAVVFVVLQPLLKRIPWRIRLKRKYGRNRGYSTILRCRKLMWVLSACGVRRDETETLTEFGRRISKECEWIDKTTVGKIHSIFEQTSKAIYSADGGDARIGDGIDCLVIKAYVRRFGLLKYLRGQRRASL